MTDDPSEHIGLYLQDVIPSDHSLCHFCHHPFLDLDLLPLHEETPDGPWCCLDCYDAFLITQDLP